MLKEEQKETELLMEMYSKTSFNIVKLRKRNLIKVKDREREREREKKKRESHKVSESLFKVKNSL